MRCDASKTTRVASCSALLERPLVHAKGKLSAKKACPRCRHNKFGFFGENIHSTTSRRPCATNWQAFLCRMFSTRTHEDTGRRGSCEVRSERLSRRHSAIVRGRAGGRHVKTRADTNIISERICS